MADRWTPEELKGWADFLSMKAVTPPTQRAPGAVRSKIRAIYPNFAFGEMPQEAAHQASLIAMKHLHEVSYKRSGDHVDFVDRCVMAAFDPLTHMPEDEAVTDVVVEIREALCGSHPEI